MSDKFKIILSDLHLGAGHQSDGNRLEDFAQDQELADFLAEIASESERDETEVELILNGDIFEMLQVPSVDHFVPDAVYSPDKYQTFSEIDAVRKIDVIITGHRPVFEALGRFVQGRSPRRSATIIKGNHDLDLYWPAVKERIRSAVADPEGAANVPLAFEERCVCREGIYVEHGNQYAGPVSRVRDMEKPVRQDDPTLIDVPLGSWFITEVFNTIERDRYWVDGVKPITALIWYSLAYDFAFAVRVLQLILEGVPALLPRVVLARHAGGQDLMRDLQTTGQTEELSRRYNSDAAFRVRFNAQVAQILSPLTDTPQTDTITAKSMGNASEMGERVQNRIRSSLETAAHELASQTSAEVVVFGHTHQAAARAFPEARAAYFNAGTWTWHADFRGEGKDTWRDLFEHPERFTDDRQLNYVRIDYDEGGRPKGSLEEYRPASHQSLWARVQSWFPTTGE